MEEVLNWRLTTAECGPIKSMVYVGVPYLVTGG
jgi:hypothetical protein